MNMSKLGRREFLKTASASAGVALFPSLRVLSQENAAPSQAQGPKADYAVYIRNALVEIGKNRFVSTVTYNGQFPGPLLRFREGERVTIDIHNETDVPEQIHWHGQEVPVDVDGAAEEGTRPVLDFATKRISFVSKPSGLRFYHTHLRAAGDLDRGQYTGQVGPVYIEPKSNPGRYDREVFLTLKEFEPWFSHGGDMSSDFMAGAAVPELKLTAYLAPTQAANASSNSPTFGPVVSQSDRSTRATACTSSSSTDCRP